MRNTKLVFAAFFGLALAIPARAGGLQDWFNTLLKGLTSETAQRYASRGVSLTSVAAIRGAPLGQQDPADPYWKGGVTDSSSKAIAEERKEFSGAVQLVVSGKADEGAAALRKFQGDHPKSVFMPDVKEALAKLEPIAPAKKAADCAPKADTCSDEPAKVQQGPSVPQTGDPK